MPASADLSGTVTDNQGQSLPGVAIALKNVEDSSSRSVLSFVDGRYRFSDLAPSKFALKAELEGNKPIEITDIDLTVGQDAELSMSSILF